LETLEVIEGNLQAYSVAGGGNRERLHMLSSTSQSIWGIGSLSTLSSEMRAPTTQEQSTANRTIPNGGFVTSRGLTEEL